MYIYASHLGGFYAEQQDLDSLYCEDCGDSDTPIGKFDTASDFLEYYSENIAIHDNDGGYNLDYVLEFLKDTFTDCPIKQEAVKIIKESRRTV